MKYSLKRYHILQLFYNDNFSSTVCLSIFGLKTQVWIWIKCQPEKLEMEEGTLKEEYYLSDVLWMVQVHELDEVVQSPHSVVLLNKNKIIVVSYTFSLIYTISTS